MSAKEVFLISFSIFVLGIGGFSSAGGQNGLVKDFYNISCSKAQQLVKNITAAKVQNDPTLAAKLLRLHFHDCFVRGCDASILLDTVGTNQAEKEARPNLSLLGFDVIDDIKSQLEQLCPNTVSCADILALAARDSVSVPFERPMWDVPTGRRDGRVSLISEAISDIPSPFLDYNTLNQMFANKGLTATDLVVLSGAHTIGVAHCSTFTKRLYNFTGKGDQDPSLDPTYAESLKIKCPSNQTTLTTTVDMDPNSSQSFDTNYFSTVKQKKGLFQTDAALLTDRFSAKLVVQMQMTSTFFSEFSKSMKKMGAIGVITGSSGEIRKNCRMVN